MHPQIAPVSVGCALELQHNPIREIRHQLAEDFTEDPAALGLQSVVGAGALLEIPPQVPGFIGRALGV